MSKIDELLAELCPDGVEYRRLGDIGTFVRGSGIQKKDFVDEGKPCIHYGQIYTQYGLSSSTAISNISDAQYDRSKKAEPNSVVFAITSENMDDVCTPFVWEGEIPAAISGHSCTYTSDLALPRFIAYWVKSASFVSQKVKIARGTKVIEVSPKDLERVEIPVPPIEIQQEIVRILDSFTELEARKVQYGYYRDQLLTYDDRVEWKMLSEIGTPLTYGANESAVDGNPAVDYRYIRITDIRNDGTLSDDWKTANVVDDKYVLKDNDLLFARSGATVGKTFLYRSSMGHALYAGYLIKMHPDPEIVNARYLYHCVNTQRYWRWVEDSKGTGAQPNIGAKKYGQFRVPLPPLDEQQKIVDILDRFEALTTSLTDGLPAEIDACRKQYAYYRDKLLDFPRKGE